MIVTLLVPCFVMFQASPSCMVTSTNSSVVLWLPWCQRERELCMCRCVRDRITGSRKCIEPSRSIFHTSCSSVLLVLKLNFFPRRRPGCCGIVISVEAKDTGNNNTTREYWRILCKDIKRGVRRCFRRMVQISRSFYSAIEGPVCQ